MIKPQLPANEFARLQELLSLQLLDTEAEDTFDHIVKLASHITGCPTSLISLIDTDRQWFKAKIGLEVPETSRDVSFCGHAIHHDELLLIENALEDERFFDNPLVTSGPMIRFYAGQPLITSNGFRIGTLCAIDGSPKALTDEQKNMLDILAKQAVKLFELRVRRLTQSHLKELEEAAKKLAFERNLLEQIFQQSPAGMALWKGKDHVFEKVNPGYQSIFGTRQLVGKPVLEAIPEIVGQGFLEMLTSVFETGEPFIGHEVLARLKSSDDGELEDHYYDFSYLQIKDADGKPYGVYDHSIDVTERVLSRRNNQKALSDLEQERELRERFVSALTHDLRTPLTAAKMSAQLLDRKLDISSQKLTRRIMANMDRADDMIRDILDASKIKAGEKFLFDLQSCNIQLIAQQVVEDFTSIYGSRFNLEAMGDMNGVWDESLIQRMMENLVNNAIKYGHSASPIGIRIHHYQEKVEISVHNFGNPISEENQKRMFQPYTRVEANPASQKGWGIGLTLVKGFAEGMGGTVDVESSVEKGTTFTISLPFHVIE